MSIGSWYIGIVKVIEQARMLKDGKEADDKFWHAHSVQEGVAMLKEDSAFRFRRREERARGRAPRHHADQAARPQYLGRHALQRAIDVVSNRLQSGLAFLATVARPRRSSVCSGPCGASTTRSPRSASRAGIDRQVAGPVGEALIMTALGLAVAVPRCSATTGWSARNRGGDGVHPALRRGRAHVVLGRGGRTRAGLDS